jgi:hypothetical protein
MESYGGWMMPDYPLLLLDKPMGGRVKRVPAGLEVIACIDEPGYTETVTLYLSRASFDALDKQRMAELKAAMLYPMPSEAITLEDALRRHDQHEICYVDPAVGITERDKRLSYPHLQMCNAAEYLLRLHDERKKLDEMTMQEAMRRIVQQRPFGMRPFRLQGGVFYSRPQADAIREIVRAPQAAVGPVQWRAETQGKK